MKNPTLEAYRQLPGVGRKVDIELRFERIALTHEYAPAVELANGGTIEFDASVDDTHMFRTASLNLR